MTQGMGRFEHGGDIYTHEGAIDFSANINPLGIPAAALEAVRANVSALEVYPDIECRDLREAIARFEGTQSRYVVCTAGVTDLLHRLCQVLKSSSSLVTAPCFSGYEQALEQAGSAIIRHPLEEDEGFELTDSIAGFSAWDTPPEVVFLCNPNNPTGLTISPELIRAILDEARDAGIVVVLDECFLDFTHEPSAVSLCEAYPNLVIMRAFTKMFAMAGLRLGYGICSDEQLVARLIAAGQLWAVSGPAQVAGRAALDVEGWTEQTRAYVDEQRAVLQRGLEDCGMRVIPGKANYLMFSCDRDLYAPLLEKGFLIRRCENYIGLDGRWYRVAVRTAQENAALIAAVKEVVVS